MDVDGDSGDGLSQSRGDDATSSSFSEFLDRIGEEGSRLNSIEESGRPTSGEHDDSVSLSELAATVNDRLPVSEWEWSNFEEIPRGVAPPETDSLDESFNSVDRKADALLELLADVSNILVVGPLRCLAEYDACSKLLTSHTDVPTNRLLVTYNELPDDRLAVCRGYLGDASGETVVINVGNSTQSRGSGVNHSDQGAVKIETMTNASDVRRLGMLLSKQLSEWENHESDVVVCFHSLTDMFQYVDFRIAFQFLHLLQIRINSVGARAHYHLSADSLDEHEMTALRQISDVVLTYTEDEALSLA